MGQSTHFMSVVRQPTRLVVTRSIALGLLAGIVFGTFGTRTAPVHTPSASKVLEGYSKAHSGFEANVGQADASVKFLHRGDGYSMLLTPTEVVLALGDGGRRSRPPHLLKMRFAGGSRTPEIAGFGELPGKANYFLGDDPAVWRTGVPIYAEVRYRGVYPGVGVNYHRNQSQLEYDLVVAPGADVRSIALQFEGADRLELDAGGDLVIHVAGKEVRHRKPVAYQEAGEAREEVAASYRLKGEALVEFEVAPYDATRPLVVDPVLAYSTYLGGGGDDFGTGVWVDDLGNAYVTGWTQHGTVQQGASYAFVVKVNLEGDLLYTTYLGGGDEFEVIGIAVDASGSAYITGFTGSNSFPTTPGAYQRTLRGELDVFVTKLNAAGSDLEYSTYIGGTGLEGSQSIAVDANGAAYVTGLTNSTDFPTTPDAAQPAFGGVLTGLSDAFVTKLDPMGSSLVYATYVGGGSSEFAVGLAIDSGGNAYVTGLTESDDFPTTAGAFQVPFRGAQDCFVTKLDPAGSSFVSSTYLGGGGVDEGRDIAVDDAGYVYVTGLTNSVDFPTTASSFQPSYRGTGDVFVAKLTPDASALVYASYLGGRDYDFPRRLVLDPLGHAYVTGATKSPDFPVTSSAIQGSHGGREDAFIARINPRGTAIAFSTFLGGSANDRARGMAIDAAKQVYVAGFTASLDFPTVKHSTFAGGIGPCFFDEGCDAFIAKLTEVVPLTVRLLSTAASVPRGTALPLTVTFSNSTAREEDFVLVLTLRLPSGAELLVAAPAPVRAPGRGASSLETTVGPIPSWVPAGPSAINARIVRRVVGGDEILDQSVLRITIP